MIESKTSSLILSESGFAIVPAGEVQWILTLERVPQELAGWIVAHIDRTWMIILAMNVIMLIIGTVLDLPAAMLLLGPLFIGIAQSIGMDPVQLGLIMVLNLAIGLYTPPSGRPCSFPQRSPAHRSVRSSPICCRLPDLSRGAGPWSAILRPSPCTDVRFGQFAGPVDRVNRQAVVADDGGDLGLVSRHGCVEPGAKQLHRLPVQMPCRTDRPIRIERHHRN